MSNQRPDWAQNQHRLDQWLYIDRYNNREFCRPVRGGLLDNMDLFSVGAGHREPGKRNSKLVPQRDDGLDEDEEEPMSPDRYKGTDESNTEISRLRRERKKEKKKSVKKKQKKKLVNKKRRKKETKKRQSKKSDS